MVRTALKTVWAHKLRLALTSLAIVLGVGFIAGTFVFTDTINRTFDSIFADSFAGIDVIVQVDTGEGPAFAGPPPFDQELLEVVQEVEGVAAAEGSVFGFALLTDEQGDAILPVGPPTLGGSWSVDPRLQGNIEIRSGRAPTGPGEVTVDARTAEDNDLQPGDIIDVIVPIGTERVEVVGVVGFGETDNLGGATFAGFELREAQRLLDVEGRFHGISVAVADGADDLDVLDAVAAVLPDGMEAVLAADEAAEQAEALQDQLADIRVGLLIFAFVSVFVASFIIQNTFRIIISQRTRELGLLRAVGATGRQVVAMVIAEAVVVAIVASVLGLLFGFAVSALLLGVTEALGFDLPTTSMRLGGDAVVWGLTVGVGVTVAASILPALRAARIPPIAALQDVPSHRPGSMLRRTYLGAGILAVGVLVIAIGLYDLVDLPIGDLFVVGIGLLVVFIGVSVLSVLVVRPVAIVVASPFVGLGKVTGRLARENAIRRPRRTATTASALMIGLALVGFFFIFAASFRESLSATIEDTLRADFVIGVEGFAGGMPTTVAGELESLPELAAVTELRVNAFDRNGSDEFLVGINAATAGETLFLDIEDGSLAALEEGGVMVYSGTAENEGWGVGDVVEMGFAATGRQQVPIVGIYAERDALPFSPSFLLGLATYEANFPEQLDFAIGVKVAEGTGVEVARDLIDAAVEPYPQVNVQDQVEFREAQEEQINVALILLTVLLVFAVIIALFGITNTLVLSVHERTREIGLLRAVGMSRWQVRRMVLWESIVVAVLGGLLGAVVGLFFGVIVVSAAASIGITVLAIPWVLLGVLIVASAIAGILAAIFPARRAARLDILEAIAYE